jgi:N-succinyl-L-ornithine transcarbamylase
MAIKHDKLQKERMLKSTQSLHHFLSVNDVQSIDRLVKKALGYKADPLKDCDLGKNKKIGLIFLNPSMRTRLSTQIAAQNLGMEPIVFNVDKEGWALEFEEEAMMSGNKVEHVKDAAPVLGKYFDILCIRTFPSLKNREDDYSELFINQFSKYSGIPVVSLESATLHPQQSLTDIMTITECLASSVGGKKQASKNCADLGSPKGPASMRGQ